MVECFKNGLIVQGIFHDWSKFTWKEFKAYSDHFYGKNEEKYKQISKSKEGYAKTEDEDDDMFNDAWLHHVHNNPHHWQYWVMVNGNGDKPLEIPVKYRKEMLCDWIGAGKAQGRFWKSEVRDWYHSHKDTIKMAENTRQWIELQLK